MHTTLQILALASEYTDTFQGPAESYMHHMRRPRQSLDKAREEYERFKCDQLSLARKLTNRDLALWALGMGMHALMDSTAPGHRDFQEWKGFFPDESGSDAPEGQFFYDEFNNAVHGLQDDFWMDARFSDLAKAVSAVQAYYNDFLNRNASHY